MNIVYIANKIAAFLPLIILLYSAAIFSIVLTFKKNEFPTVPILFSGIFIILLITYTLVVYNLIGYGVL